MTQNRQPAGIPTGGQFAADSRSRANLSLDGLSALPVRKVLPGDDIAFDYPSEQQLAEKYQAFGMKIDCGFNWRHGNETAIRLTLDEQSGTLYAVDRTGRTALLATGVNQGEVDAAWIPLARSQSPALSEMLYRLSTSTTADVNAAVGVAERLERSAAQHTVNVKAKSIAMATRSIRPEAARIRFAVLDRDARRIFTALEDASGYPIGLSVMDERRMHLMLDDISRLRQADAEISDPRPDREGAYVIDIDKALAYDHTKQPS